MKVNVLTVEDVSIRKFRWWSNWVDVAMFDYCGFAYLLQMKINRINRKRFTAIKIGGIRAHVYGNEAGDLVQMEKDK